MNNKELRDFVSLGVLCLHHILFLLLTRGLSTRMSQRYSKKFNQLEPFSKIPCRSEGTFFATEEPRTLGVETLH
jgi:hypothetical protein